VFGCGYRRIADASCPATTLRRRRDEWIALGLAEQLHQLALAAYDRLHGLEPEHLAILSVLMLRGPQTGGELRSRTERLHPFTSQDEVDDVLRQLAGRNEPLVARLERRAGQKESRWAHLLGGDLAEALAGDDAEDDDRRPSPRTDRIAALEDALADLRADLDRLRTAHRNLVARLGESDDLAGD